MSMAGDKVSFTPPSAVGCAPSVDPLTTAACPTEEGADDSDFSYVPVFQKL